MRASKSGTPLTNHYFTAISWSSMRTVVDRHRLTAYYGYHAYYYTSAADELSGGTNIDDLERP